MSIGKGSYFRRYWIGEALSTLGTRTGNIAYPLLALELTGSPARAGLLAFARSAAWFVLSLPAGAIVDRVDRRRLMIGCDVASALAMAVLVLALASGRLTYGQLLAIGLLQGIFAVFFRIAEVGALRHLVADEDLPTAIAQNTARDSAAWLAGPPLGGLLYAVRRSLPFVVDFFSYLASAAILLSIRKPFHEEREHEPWSVRTHLGDIRSGVTWLFAQPFLRTATFLVSGANFVSNAVSFLLVIVVRQRGGSAPEIGLMMSCAAAGALLGAGAATRLHRIVAPRLIVVGYPWLGAIAALLIAIPLPALALGAIYGAWVFFGPTWDAVVGGHRIRIVPDAMQGRVESVTTLVAIGGAALGPLVGGLLASRLTGSASFVCVAAIGTCVALAGVAGWSRGLRTISAEAPA
jgi:MFS family permease